jgi:hypothetical protein
MSSDSETIKDDEVLSETVDLDSENTEKIEEKIDPVLISKLLKVREKKKLKNKEKYDKVLESQGKKRETVEEKVLRLKNMRLSKDVIKKTGKSEIVEKIDHLVSYIKTRDIKKKEKKNEIKKEVVVEEIKKEVVVEEIKKEVVIKKELPKKENWLFDF